MGHKPAQRAGEEAGQQRPATSRFHRLDTIVALIILAICAFLFWRTLLFDTVPSSLAQNVQPAMFPQMLLVFIAALALLLPFEHRQKRKQGIDLDEDRRTRPKLIVFITSAVMLILVASMPWLGTYVGLLLAAAGLPLLWGERRYKILVPYAVLFPTALIWLFAGALQVSFLPGITGYLFR